MPDPKVPGRALSLTARVAIAVTGVLLVGGVLVTLAAFAYGRQAAREAYDRLLVGAATEIAAAITVQGGRILVDLPVSAFDLLALAPDDRVLYRVIGPDGATLTGYESPQLPPGRPSAQPDFFDGMFGSDPARFVAVSRRFVERSLSGTVTVIVGQTTRARRALAVDITRNALIVLAATGATMTLLAVLAVRSALRPLDRIGETLRRRDPYDLTAIDLDVPREAAVMLSALNGFMDRLDRQVSSMRNLIGDAAHQLRTPVAALRAQADLVAGEADPDRQHQILERIRHRAVGLSRLLDQMLSRALVIHRAESVPRARIDLRDVAVEVLEDSEDDPAASTVQLELPDMPVMVQGDALSLAEACKNLLNNAFRHGKAPVRLGVTDDGARARIWVHDSGDGPPPEILRRAGARHARSAASKSDSAGLGLAIAYSVAQAHAGKIEMSPMAEGGFRIAMALPALEAST